MTGITSADHGDAVLVQPITIHLQNMMAEEWTKRLTFEKITHQDANTDDGINIGKVTCDGVL